MGCGKSSVGRELSRLLCCPFMDLDDVIQDRAGKTITEIFAAEGEAVFRQMEREALTDILASRAPHKENNCIAANSVHLNEYFNATVLALGGGTVMTPECAKIVHENTLCIYLRSSVDTLARNLTDEAAGRPMLQGNLQARIEELMGLRTATYENTAHIIIDTDGKSVEAIASEIAGKILN